MTELMQIQLRPLAAADVEAVLRIQAQCYGQDFLESRDVYARRLAMAGHCSWAAVRGPLILAYMAAYSGLGAEGGPGLSARGRGLLGAGVHPVREDERPLVGPGPVPR